MLTHRGKVYSMKFNKTKYMVVGANTRALSLRINDYEFEKVQGFPYLGSYVDLSLIHIFKGENVTSQCKFCDPLALELSLISVL